MFSGLSKTLKDTFLEKVHDKLKDAKDRVLVCWYSISDAVLTDEICEMLQVKTNLEVKFWRMSLKLRS